MFFIHVIQKYAFNSQKMINLLEMGKFKYPASNLHAIKNITDDPNNL